LLFEFDDGDIVTCRKDNRSRYDDIRK